MDAKRWQQIEILFHQVLLYPASEREDFMAQACAGDENLRVEIETLLAFHRRNRSFLESPALDDAAKLLVTRQNQLAFGQQFGNYQILTLLGVGGMGEVYLAEDVRLKRKVALKVLPLNLIYNRNLVQRFQQEARTASALNHPNILTIYEVGQDQTEICYIAAEYIDGETIRQILSDRQMTLNEILGVTLQTASALAAAHEAGVIHRDIKPQNIMLRSDGYVKVLDFGIAKLIENDSSKIQPDSLFTTEKGTILGTAYYMSPEQARGLKVDARSDLWSLGVTLYEMITSQTPFTGSTTSDVIVSILEREPFPLAKFNADAPERLEQIIKRCLTKDINDRYQNAAELIEDLQSLQNQIETEVSFSNSAKQTSDRRKNKTSKNRFLTGSSADSSVPEEKQFNERWSKSYSTKTIVSANKGYIAFAAVLLTFIIGTLIATSNNNASRLNQFFLSNDSVKSFEPVKVNKLTNSGNVVLANVSSDGKYIAYVIQESEQQTLWIKQIAAATPKLVVPSSGNLYRGVTFSIDSNFIYYVVHEKAKGVGVLYAVPVLGGDSRKILEDVDSPVTFSPDGKSFAFMRGFDDNGARAHALLIASVENGSLRQLAVRKDPDFFSRDGFAWSPDGAVIIAAATKVSDSAQKFMQLVEIQVSDGSARAFTANQWEEIGKVTWLGKDNRIVMTAIEQKAGLPWSQIVQVSYPEGKTESVTKGLNGYREISATSDGQNIAAIEQHRVSHVWTAPGDNPNQVKRITPGVGSYYQTSWTPDNKIIYVSEESGNQDIWTMEADGGGAKQLTFNAGRNCYPKVSPDNRYIVFASNRTGAFHLWRMDRDGSNPRQLTDGIGETYPDISPDSQFVYHMSFNSHDWYLSKVSIDGGAAAQLFDHSARFGNISPSGEWIVGYFPSEKANSRWSKWQVAIFSAAEAKMVKTLDIPTDTPWQLLRWVPNEQAITYVDVRDNLFNLWSYPFREGVPQQLTHFNSSDQIFHFDWSSNGKSLVCLRGLRSSDVVYLNRKFN